MALTISATDTELPAPLNAVFQQTLLRNAMVRCPYFIGTTPAELSKHRGSFQASFRRIANLSTATSGLTQLTGEAAYMQARSAAALSVSAVNATVAKYGNFVILNEEAEGYLQPRTPRSKHLPQDELQCFGLVWPWLGLERVFHKR